VVYLALPFALLAQAIKGFRNHAYWKRWGERLGYCNPGSPVDLWIHAVSVGEVRAAVPMINRFLADNPAMRILVTTMTPTGSDTVGQLLGGRVAHCYLPYDTGAGITRFLDSTGPSTVIVMETEIWPNLIRLCKERGIQVVYINVRLSQRSFERYQRISSFIATVLGRIDLIAVQGDADANRIRQLGAEASVVRVTGSIKFDAQIPASVSEAAQMVRRTLGDERLIWIAGSTREGEEGMILGAYQELKNRFPGLLLLLVPRHPERFDSVARQCRRAGLEVVRRSADPIAVPETTDVYLGDTMGELALLYAAADVAFVGGSLVPTGGQNILEPCALGIPVVFGPHMFNFQDISRWAVDGGAGFQVPDANRLVATLDQLLRDADLRFQTGERAMKLIEGHRGALDRVYELLTSETVPD
jgi:3-deoxy-D-manno-octulosonic-acid transferase